MSRTHRLYVVDSFTTTKFRGNPAGVIANADGLTDHEMQQIARELNHSETAFILTPKTDQCEVHLRFFTPRKEVPICGHATVAAHYVRAVEQQLGSVRVMHETGAGILPVDILREENGYRITMTQGKIEFGTVIDGADRHSLLTALGIGEEDLMKGWPIQIVSTGHSKVMIGIKSRNVLNRLTPGMEALARLSESIGCNGYFVFTLDCRRDGIMTEGRMFAPAIGINEDPVTGNAHGPLGAYLVHHRLVEHDGASLRFNGLQGEAMGREGIIGVDVSIDDGEPVEVRISGEAIIVFRSELII